METARIYYDRVLCLKYGPPKKWPDSLFRFDLFVVEIDIFCKFVIHIEF